MMRARFKDRKKEKEKRIFRCYGIACASVGHRQKKFRDFVMCIIFVILNGCILLPDFTLVNAPCQWKQLFHFLHFILLFLPDWHVFVLILKFCITSFFVVVAGSFSLFSIRICMRVYIIQLLLQHSQRNPKQKTTQTKNLCDFYPSKKNEKLNEAKTVVLCKQRALGVNSILNKTC